MLPESYDNVSEETKHTVQLFIARASGFLQGKGLFDEDVLAMMEKIEAQAMKEAVEMAVDAWEESRESCSAEQFVQRFADLVWEEATGTDERFWPYQYSAPVAEGPLSTEFLEAVGITEEEVRKSPPPKEQSPKEQSPKKQSPKKQSRKKQNNAKNKENSEQAVKLPLCPETAFEEPKTFKFKNLNALTMQGNVRAKFAKRKSGEPETTTPKSQGGDDGQKSPPVTRTKRSRRCSGRK